MGARLLPTETKCPVCLHTFLQPRRIQGGGKRTIYCSPRCRSLDWVRGNGASRKASILKYQESEKGQAYYERTKFRLRCRKYGWTIEQFHRQLARQGNRCYGCFEHVNAKAAFIDHDHATGIVRGLLCSSCNTGLGLLKDNPEILRRLMTYLQRDISQTLVYLAGSLRNPRIREIGNAIRKEGFDVMDEWHTPGEHADDSWQEYERARGRSYTEALAGRGATNIFLFDKSYIDLCDVFVVAMPAGKSAMLELGYASGMGKATYLLLDGTEPERFDVMPNFAIGVISSVEELIAELRKYGL